MINKKEDKPLDLNLMEKWLEHFFLDPLTSYLDETVFRIDLFETADEFIVEAWLVEYNPLNITVVLNDDKIVIEVINHQDAKECKQRVITMPFSVIHHEVTTIFESGILEVYISKNKKGKGRNRKMVVYHCPISS
jgi:HSP20 family molecular chaperone IbpA